MATKGSTYGQELPPKVSEHRKRLVQDAEAAKARRAGKARLKHERRAK